MPREQVKMLHRYNKWQRGTDEISLTDEEVLFLLSHFEKLVSMLMPLTRYGVAAEATAHDWNRMHMIAHARGLRT